jgi:GxxExxY protein
MTENQLASGIIGLAIEVHKLLGPGLLESVYKECLFDSIQQNGFHVEKEIPIPVVFKERKLNCGFRIDLLVEKKLVLEIKSVEALNDIHFAQTLTYLRLGDFRLGLIINFNVILLKSGLRRVVNNLNE